MFLLLCLSLVLLLSSCGSKYKDGSYIGKYTDEDGETTELSIDIKEDKIVNASIRELDPNGDPKDSNYGRDGGNVNWQTAQYALLQVPKYEQMVLEAQEVDKLDSISGATVSYLRLKEALKEALESAR